MTYLPVSNAVLYISGRAADHLWYFAPAVMVNAR